MDPAPSEENRAQRKITDMQKPSWFVVAFTAAAGMVFASPVFATVTTTAYGTGGGNSSDQTTPYGDTQGYVGFSGSEYVSWSGFTTSSNAGSPGTAQLLFHVNSTFGGARTVEIWTLNEHGTADGTWQKYDSTHNWSSSTPYGPDRGAMIGSVTVNGTGTYSVDLDATATWNTVNNGFVFGFFDSVQSGSARSVFDPDTQLVLNGTAVDTSIPCPMCKFLPQLSWAEATDTGNGTATNTWTNRGSFVFGNSTTTFPLCAAWKWLEIWDILAATTNGSISPQAMQIRTNFGYSTSTYFISTTSTAGTTDIAGFTEIVKMIHDWAQMIGWSLFCMQVLMLVLTRKNTNEVHD